MELKEALEEKKARSHPARIFTKTVTELEDRILEDILDEDVEAAVKLMTEAYSTLYKVHQTYLTARQGSEEEELPEDPEDTRWMDQYKKSRTDVLAKYREWKEGKAASLAEATAAKEEKRLATEKAARLAEQISLLEAKLPCVGDLERNVQEFMERNMTVEGFRCMMKEDDASLEDILGLQRSCRRTHRQCLVY